MTVTVTEKVCSVCKQLLPASMFFEVKRGRTGLFSQCRDCHYERARRHHLRVNYGLTPETYEALVAAQGGVCAICGCVDTTQDREFVGRKNMMRRNLDTLRVDHDHETGKVRGLLCDRCNRGIGMLEHKIEYLESAIRYLRRTE